jgi:hypothetical protein
LSASIVIVQDGLLPAHALAAQVGELIQPANVEPLTGTAVRVTGSPAVNRVPQRLPQLIPTGLEVRVPPPPTVLATVLLKTWRICVPPVRKVAVTLLGPSMVTVQVGRNPVHAPNHPVKPATTLSVAVSVMTVSGGKSAWQIEPQEMPAGDEVMTPLPPAFPFLITVRVGGPAAAKLAVTALSLSKVTVQLPPPLHAPAHPLKTEPASGAAVKVTGVPAGHVKEHADPQSMPAGNDVTEPLPDVVTDSV